MLRNKQEQHAGDYSTNVQAGNDVNLHQNNYGLSYREVKEVALDVFEVNFSKLSLAAQKVAKERAEEITTAFLSQLQKKNPEALETMKEPDMQYALLMAQKEYARTGDENLSEVLVDILVERSKIQERSLMQVVLNESLEVVPKLTNGQLNILSLIFIIKYTINNNVRSIDSLKTYLKNWIAPYMDGLTKRHSHYQHLEYTGCGTVGIGETHIITVFTSNYGGLFSKGFSLEQFNDDFNEDSPARNLLFPCLHDSSLFQMNAINEQVLKEHYTPLSLKEEQNLRIGALHSKSLMSEEEIWNFLVGLCPEINDLLDIWSDSSIKNMTLTSVGVALAHANIRRKTNEELDLSNWI
ncbi:LPO_1073/Vpar_1526 family protein [Bacillus sp. ISL-57]|uniref:LPO_1073/Vpar_1526 family protein n=1 Tax=Bacillus sp. ISL-57 TaxID=2819135 RepID=UPI001BE8F7A8|nr:LPO_1073/Vpar_1526 family protein [Bacillus sp. ISL-57]MBT2714709.1 hypothetical protein [Bacillus sp. ISL-57]